MRRLTRRKTLTEELKDAAIEALANALDDDDKRAAKSGTKGVRALVAGAVIYTAGRAAFKGQRFVREQLSSDTEEDQPEYLEDEEETRAYAEPEGEEYEVDEEEDEPEAVEEAEALEEEDEPGASDEADDEQDEPQGAEDSGQPEARREPDDESSSKTPAPLSERKPMRRVARRKGAQPSFKLPKQRRARMRMAKD